MKNALKILSLTSTLVFSLNANASILARVEAVFCQGPNSSTYIDLQNNTIERARFKTEIRKIENVLLDEKNGLITFSESGSSVVNTLKLMGGIYSEDRVSIDYYIGKSFLFECQGRVSKI